jgi:hypothetical protein
MAKDLKDIIKKGSKSKVMQLAINSSITPKDNLLSEAEKEAIRDRANKEGWGGELERATEKARYVVMIAMETEKLLYQSMYFLSIFTKESLIKRRGILAVLYQKYLKHDTKTDTYKTIKKTKREIQDDIKSIRIYDLRIYGRFGGDKFEQFVNTDSNKRELWHYFRLFNGAKESIYLYQNAKVSGYRLYDKKNIDNFKIVLTFNRECVMEVINLAEDIVFFQEAIKKHAPEVFTELQSIEWFVIDSKPLKTFVEELEVVVDLQLTKEEIEGISEGNELNMFGDETINEKYLLAGIDKGSIDRMQETLTKVTKYVKNGR